MTAGSAVGLYAGEETLREFREDGREDAEDAASSLSMRALSMLRLTLRLCRVSGDRPSKADAVGGGASVEGLCEPNDALRRSSEWSIARLAVRRGRGCGCVDPREDGRWCARS